MCKAKKAVKIIAIAVIAISAAKTFIDIMSEITVVKAATKLISKID